MYVEQIKCSFHGQSILEKHTDGRLFISDIWPVPTSDQLDMIMEGRVQHSGYIIFLWNWTITVDQMVSATLGPQTM